MKIVRVLMIGGAFVLVACGSSDRAPSADAEAADPANIVGGKKDSGHPAVVAIDINGDELCTGTLIGPHTVLTARHCVGDTTEDVSCPAQGSQVGALFDPSAFTIYAGEDIQTATPIAAGKKVIVPNSKELCEHDVALLVLDRDVTDIDPMPVERDNPPAPGDEFTAVGFGKRTDAGGAGVKVSKTKVKILEVSPSEIVVGKATCNGDSGGPAINAKGAVVGVVSRGGPTCAGTDVQNIYTRPDAFLSLVDKALK